MGASYSFQGVLIEPVIYGDFGAWTAWYVLTVAIVVTVVASLYPAWLRREQSRRRITGGVMSEPILVARGVTKVFELGRQEVRALRGVDLEVREGEFLALVGPSGSGKTTLLNLVGALDVPTSGDLRVLGQQIATLSRRERADLRLRSIGFVFQAFNLVPVLTALENVEFVLELQGFEHRRDRARAVLQELGLADLADRRPSELSGGSSGSLWHERSPHARRWSSPTNRPRISTARTPRSSCT